VTAHDRYDSLFQFYASARKIEWRLLKAQVKAESVFKPRAASTVGAKGLAQFMDPTWNEWKSKVPEAQFSTPYEPEAAIAMQAAYMSWLLSSFGGDIELALAAYNWGIGRVKKASEGGKKWSAIEANAPAETRDYVKKIMGFKKEYDAARTA